VTADSGDSADFDAVFATRAISDLVPNPWHARRLVDQYAARLLANGWTQAKLGQHSSHVIDSLKAALRRQVEAEARKVFEDHLRQGRIRFQLVASPWAWRMPESESVILTSDPRLLARRSDGQMPQRSWLEPLHENDLNGLELEVALYLDEQQTILWWYRNLVRESGYSLQGWRRERVYPDFLFAFQVDGSNRRLIALETKGEHLSGNEDTTYKQALFDTLNAACLAGDFETIGSLQIEDANNARLECRMAVQPEWRATVDAILARID
jgi:type III restriction enzyme